jgi:hypothetical protein
LSAIVLFTALLVTACAAQVPLGRTLPQATNAPDASAQDVVPATTVSRDPTLALMPAPTSRPSGIPAAPEATGKVILVSLSRQQLYAYQDGALAFTFSVETRRPALPTPTGVFHVFQKACSDKRWVSNTAPTAAPDKARQE